METKTGCPESLATATLPRLADTDLPKNFAECVARVGVRAEEPRHCTFSTGFGNALYRQCVQAGGGVTRVCGRGGSCNVDYTCGWRPCLGELCE